MRRGFTLLEVLLGLGLIAALSGGVFAFMWQIASQKSALAERATDGQAGDAILERIEADLAGAIAADSAGNAGIVGTETSLRVLSRGVVLSRAAGDRVWAAGDLQGTEYAASAGAITARRWDAHRNRGGASGTAETVSTHVAAFRLRYYDGTEWVTSFDSKSRDGLPVAVEVAMWFGEEEAIDREATDRAPTSREAPPGVPLDEDGNPLFVDEPVVEAVELPRPSRSPDRLRVIVVPDGPTTAWKELR